MILQIRLLYALTQDTDVRDAAYFTIQPLTSLPEMTSNCKHTGN